VIARFSFGNRILKADLSRGWDISLPVRFGKGSCRAWYAPEAHEEPLNYGRPASVKEGFAVNSYQMTLAPHSHSTHTEWRAHYQADRQPLPLDKIPPWMPALLLSVYPEKDGSGNQWIRRETLEALFITDEGLEALIVRTLPNTETKKTTDYSGKNPPAFEPEAMAFLRKHGVRHLFTDLPSVDPENDGGTLRAHRLFLDGDSSEIFLRTITELIFVPNECPDGLYVLNLQLAPIPGDAVPSRPLIFPVTHL
jgi:kynurenine formamidase